MDIHNDMVAMLLNDKEEEEHGSSVDFKLMEEQILDLLISIINVGYETVSPTTMMGSFLSPYILTVFLCIFQCMGRFKPIWRIVYREKLSLRFSVREIPHHSHSKTPQYRKKNTKIKMEMMMKDYVWIIIEGFSVVLDIFNESKLLPCKAF